MENLEKIEVPEIRLFKEPGKSFILYHEKNPFSRWHHHPEYEIDWIPKGRGRRMVGNHIARFEENDLVFLGSDLPHEWLCDNEYFSGPDGFNAEGIVIQFTHGFLGKKFFEVPENKDLKKFLAESARGFEIFGESKRQIISLIHKMLYMNDTDQLYSLFSILKILSSTKELKALSSPDFAETFWLNNNEHMQNALKFIMQNFQKQIQVKDLLEVTHMSNTTFSNTFKYSYRMTFKTYLMKLRVGYASTLLINTTRSITDIAFESGFENLSNFNRQFKKVKGFTPREYRMLSKTSSE